VNDLFTAELEQLQAAGLDGSVFNLALLHGVQQR